MPHLALRIITKTGMQSLIQHSMSHLQMKNGGGKSASSASGVESSEDGTVCIQQLFDPTSYKSVHNLATNTEKRNFEDLMKKTAEAIFMAKCLKFNGFFGDGETDSSPETRKAEGFISSLLLRHLQIASTNGLEMAECLLKNNDVTKFDIIPVGGAIFPTMSFFNHSCYPNALRLGYQGYQVQKKSKSNEERLCVYTPVDDSFFPIEGDQSHSDDPARRRSEHRLRLRLLRNVKGATK